MTVLLDLTDEEAAALADVVRVVRPDDYRVSPVAWYGALDKLSAQLAP